MIELPDQIWTKALVEARLEAAADVMRRLPEPRAPGYYNSWPAVLRDEFEMRATAEGPTRLTNSPKDISNAEETLLWLRCIDKVDQQLVWYRANRKPWKAITHELKIGRTTAWRRWDAAIAVITAHLNADVRTTFAHRKMRHRRPDVL